jgi:hypothetical protein
LNLGSNEYQKGRFLRQIGNASRDYEAIKALQTYLFGVVLKPAGDGWVASCPLLEKYGALLWVPAEKRYSLRCRRRYSGPWKHWLGEKRPIPHESVGEIIFSPSNHFVVVVL